MTWSGKDARSGMGSGTLWLSSTCDGWPGDRAFFYHTGKERAIVGIARVESEAYPDPGQADERVLVFEVSPQERLPQAVTLSRIKSETRFRGWELVRVPRLSVMPVPGDTWKQILEMSRPRTDR
jgi:predicted RNA-binding protein with PUA-like domain